MDKSKHSFDPVFADLFAAITKETPSVKSDTFFFLDEVNEQFRVTVAHLRNVAEAQHGVFKKKRMSDAALASYPKFTKGPGGRWGIFESQLSNYWFGVHEKNENVVNAQERFAKGARR